LQNIELPVAALLGCLMFRDFQDALALTGTTTTIGAGMFMIRRERVTGRQVITQRGTTDVRRSPT
jgi:hypothetical protein